MAASRSPCFSLQTQYADNCQMGSCGDRLKPPRRAAVSSLQLFVIGRIVVDQLAVGTTDAILLVLFGASFASAELLWTEGAKLIPSSEAGLLGTAETPLAIFLAWLVLSELPPAASLSPFQTARIHLLIPVWTLRILTTMRHRDRPIGLQESS